MLRYQNLINNIHHQGKVKSIAAGMHILGVLNPNQVSFVFQKLDFVQILITIIGFASSFYIYHHFHNISKILERLAKKRQGLQSSPHKDNHEQFKLKDDEARLIVLQESTEQIEAQLLKIKQNLADIRPAIIKRVIDINTVLRPSVPYMSLSYSSRPANNVDVNESPRP
jgi:hypothetical protein